MKNLKINFTESYLYFLSYSSLTYIFVILNFYGLHKESLDISIFQGLMSCITLGLSGDFRSLFFVSKNYSNLLIKFRLAVIFLLAIMIVLYYLKIPAADNKIFFMGLAIKRIIDWIDEIVIISTQSFLADKLFKYKYLYSQALFLILLPFVYIKAPQVLICYFVVWITINLFMTMKYYKIFFVQGKNTDLGKSGIKYSKQFIVSQLISTFLINCSNIFLRVIFLISFSAKESSMIISSFALGGMFFSITSNSFLPYAVQKNKNRLKYVTYFYNIKYLIFTLIFFIITALFYLKGYFFNLNLSGNIILISIFSGAILFISNYLRYFIIQLMKYPTLNEDSLINIIFIYFLIFMSLYTKEYLIYSTLFLSLITLTIYTLKYQALQNKKIPTLIYLCAEIFLMFLIGFFIIKYLTILL